MNPQKTATATLRNTDSSDAPARVRPALTLVQPALGPETGQGAARTRAISPEKAMRQGGKGSNFLRPHLQGAAEGLATSWSFTERPESVLDRARRVIPAKSEVPHWVLWLPAVAVGAVCLGVSFTVRLIDLAFATRRRGAVATGALALSYATYRVARTVTG
ncbi:hypothetical protein E1091_01555 [Micromonospora fluostatini]|uniref:Uncharacterized protein n=1 Tax=Micromonospora fluostatini TaxID=1629071 RepID=A0ABY2DLG7_9ACTN|nr:hypothetical protein E1091_01555 [Micromonospora fluostatini]